jgi:hypothetical protein
MRRDILRAYGLQSDKEYERQGRETDDFISRRADRTRDHSGSGAVPHIVYKTYETPPPRQQRINDLDPEVQARWDAWRDDGIERYFDAVAKEIGDEFVHFDDCDKALKQIRADIAALRAELTTLQAVQRGEVASLPLVRRVTRDDAA